MSYRTYTTTAIVCSTYRHNTDDCSYLLFTRDLGMIYATARSVRTEKSRQRYALQDFSLIKVSLVKGKAGWRVGSVEAVENFFVSLETQPGRAAAVQVISITRRLVVGEDAYQKLFSDTVAALTAIKQYELTAANIADLFTLRALWHLGYVKKDDGLMEVLVDGVEYDGAPPTAAHHKAIKWGLEQSHL